MAINKNQNGTGITLDKMIQPTLLLLICQKPAHGYELIQNFKALDPTEVVEPGTIYRYLRRMESEGFIKSQWEASEAGPARRQYQITTLGFEALKEAEIKLEHQKKQVEDFLIAFKEMKERGIFSEN